MSLAGFLPPVASATAQSIASREWSFWVDTVKSLKVGFAAWFFFQKHASAFPSEVASAGIGRLLLVNWGSAPTSGTFPLSLILTGVVPAQRGSHGPRGVLPKPLIGGVRSGRGRTAGRGAAGSGSCR